MVLHLADIAPVLIRGNNLIMVFYTDFFAEIFGPLDFVVALAVVKTYGKGFLAAEIGGNIAGIHPAGKEAAHLHVADLVGTDRVLKDLSDLLYGFFLRHGLIRFKFGLPVTVGFHPAVFEPEVMGGHQGVNALEKCFRRDGILKGNISIQSVAVEFLFIAGIFQNAFDFRAIDKISVYHSIMDRLDPKIISGDKEAFILLVPDSEAKHAPQFIQKTFFPFFKAMDKHLGVGLGGKYMTLFYESFPELPVVVNFSVESKHEGFILIIDGLVARFADIDNTQAAKAHGDVFIRIEAAAVGPTVSDDFRHTAEHFLFVSPVDDLTCKSTYSTHTFKPLVFLDFYPFFAKSFIGARPQKKLSLYHF